MYNNILQKIIFQIQMLVKSVEFFPFPYLEKNNVAAFYNFYCIFIKSYVEKFEFLKVQFFRYEFDKRKMSLMRLRRAHPTISLFRLRRSPDSMVRQTRGPFSMMRLRRGIAQFRCSDSLIINKISYS
jgi:hypothetical protein